MSSSIRLDHGGKSWTSSLWQGSTRLFERSNTIFSLSTHHEDNVEALKWATIEKLPTHNRLRTSILKNLSQNDGKIHSLNEIDVRNMELETRQQLMDRLVKVVDQDNEQLLQRLHQRIDDKVGINLPEVEVCFENLKFEVDVHVGGRALPTLYNYATNVIEGIFQSLHLYKGNKTSMTILHKISGLVKLGRLTLLLGPLASRKTTLLLALTGKLDKSLRVDGSVTFNDHNMDEFVPQRTSFYISQDDMPNGDMTVRETLDFLARFQGVRSRYDILTELSQREKEEGIKPNLDIDVFMKATAMEGQKSNMITDYVLKILGLDICVDTMIGDAMRRGVSSGQKKRVTIGEMIVGAANALFMDEISTGLDNSTTFQIVKCLWQYVHVFNSTMIISLLQPAPETYDLFNDVILLSEGYLVYQGSQDSVLKFFDSVGFRYPERKGVADFLQEVTSLKDQEKYWTDTRQPYHFCLYQGIVKCIPIFPRWHQN